MWPYTPRHDAADAAKFGITTPYIGEAYQAATNYIRVYWSAANEITLAFNDTGGAHTQAWDCTGLIAAGTEYDFEVRYSGAQMTLRVDNAIMATISTSIMFSTVMTTFYGGGKQDGTLQADAVFG